MIAKEIVKRVRYISFLNGKIMNVNNNKQAIVMEISHANDTYVQRTPMMECIKSQEDIENYWL